MSTEPICPCDRFIHPREIANPPGLSAIGYRVGEYATFRDALLRAGPGEENLTGWSPATMGGDIALQAIEWWAYLADILTFYNERIANGAYLRTAYLSGAAARIVRVLGYRPKPGVGATAMVAAIVSAKTPITLPVGFALQSKPGPGKKPEVFELGQEVTLTPGGAIPADVVKSTSIAGTTSSSLLLEGAVTTLRPGDQALAISKTWTDGDAHVALVTITATSFEKSPRGKTNTRLTCTPALPAGAAATSYRLLRSTQESRTSPYGNADVVVTSTTISGVAHNVVHLASVTRDLAAGDLIAFQIGAAAKVTTVMSYAEAIWYANGAATAPQTPPTTPTGVIPIPVLHAVLTLGTSALTSADAAARVRYGWVEAGTLIDDPSQGFIEAAADSVKLRAASDTPFPDLDGDAVIIEDARGLGVMGTATSSAAGIDVLLPTGPTERLLPPLRVFVNLLPVSRGKTVSKEVLGSGDPRVAGQSFELAKSPLTYLASSSKEAVDGLVSTLVVEVDGWAWTEVQSFYGQAPTAKVYVTRQDEDQKTTVVFGDGVNGARLPSGVNNVVASYRVGSGADAPATGSLINILKPFPGLSSVKNPIAAGGGDDPDPPAELRRMAPQSVVTFGRAISGDDYASIALGAPGVTRARAYFVWSPTQQRTVVKLYVAEGQAAVDAAKLALAAAADPSKRPIVAPATARLSELSMRLVIDAARDPEAIKKEALANLFAPRTGLFSAEVTRLGEPVYESRIHEACTRVPGVLAVHDLSFLHGGKTVGERHLPGEGAYFSFDEATVGEAMITEVATDAD